MARTWQLQEAKSKLSEVVDDAINDGPQVITRRGVPVAVVLSSGEYRRLTRRQKGLVAFFRTSPLVHADVDLSRDKGLPRKPLDL